MNKRRIVSLLILVAILVTSFSSFATPQNETYVIDNGHGEFKLDGGNISTLSSSSNSNKVKVKQIDTDLYDIVDKDILADNKDYDKLVKVNNDTFLRVKEVKIKLTNSKQIEKIIDEYDINPVMAEDIRKLSIRAKDEDSNIADELIIYTPKFKNENIKVQDDSISTLGLGYQSRYYYTGYLGFDYMDEIWYGTSSPRFRDIRTGSAVKRYLGQTIVNAVNLIIGNYIDSKTDGLFSIMEIFGHSPILYHEASTGDVQQASIEESKWRKYTSVDVGGGYSVGASSERSRHRFENMLYRSGDREYAYSPSETTVCDNYYDLDILAYRYRDLPWAEWIVSYDFNNLTVFQSIN